MVAARECAANAASVPNDGVDEHRDAGVRPEQRVAETDQRRIADRIVRGVRHRAVGPEPGVAEPLRDARRDHVVKRAVVRGRKATRRIGDQGEPRGERHARRRGARHGAVRSQERSRKPFEKAGVEQVLDDLAGGQADDVRVRAVDARDEKRADALNRIGPGLVEPLPGARVALELRGRRRCEA